MNTAQIAQEIGNAESVLELEMLVDDIGDNAALKALADARTKFFTDDDEGAWLTAEADFCNSPQDLAATRVKTPGPVTCSAAPVVDTKAVLEARKALRASLMGRISGCDDADVLETMLVPELDLATRGADQKGLRADVKAAVQTRMKALGGSKPTAAAMREMFPDLVKKTRIFGLTHYGMAQRIASETDGDLRFNITIEEWLSWDGRRWMPLMPAQVQSLARAAINRTKGEAAMLPGTDIDKLEALDSDGFRRGVEGEMKAVEQMHVEQKDLNTDIRYLTCGNGSVDLLTGELVSNRDMLLTVRNDTEFDPAAECPTFLRVLNEVFENRAEDILYYELAIGYTMTGCPAERSMFYHKGEGTNGKSLLLGAIMKSMGDHAVSVSNKVIADAPGSTTNSSAEAASPAVRRLMDRRIAVIEELPLGGNIRDSDVKALAGGAGTKVSARGLNQGIIEFLTTWTFHIACNNMPTIRQGQESVWNRVHPILYTKQFNNTVDPTLPAKLAAESAGILAWLVRCAEKYNKVKEAGGTVKDYMPQLAKDELAKLQLEQNPFTDWIEANCDVVADGFLPAGDGFKDYIAYESSVSLDGPRNIRSEKAFVTRMKTNKAFTHTAQGPAAYNRKSGFHGLRLKTAAPATPKDRALRENIIADQLAKRAVEEAARGDIKVTDLF